MTQASLYLISGIILLYIGAELLVRSAVQLALYFRVSRLVIGLTIVALMTSVPEVLTSVLGQLRTANGDIALGNMLGSNITNIGLVLGIYLLLRPTNVMKELKWQKMPILFFVYLLVLFVMIGGKISRIEGFFLLGVLILYVVFQFLFPPKKAEVEEKIKIHEEVKFRPAKITLQFFAIIGSAALLILGTDAFLRGAIDFGQLIGVSERVIAVSIIAFGTSLPELATAFVGAFRKEPEIIVGTVIGSGIFNSLLIIPCASFIRPILFSPKMLYIDFPIMVAFALLLWILMLFGHNRLSRFDGIILLIAYFSYVTFLFL